jgi:putative ABC transport system permease protein
MNLEKILYRLRISYNKNIVTQADRVSREFAESMRRERGGYRTALFLAVKDIFKDKRITGLVILVLAFSFLNVVFFTSFNYGFETTIKDNLVNTMTAHLVIEPKEGTGYIDKVSDIERKLSLIPGIVGISPHIDVNVVVTNKDRARSLPIIGITPSKENEATMIPQKVTSGEFLSDGDTNEILLGKLVSGTKVGEEKEGAFNLGELESGLKVGVGDTVVVTYDNGLSKNYHVKGIVETGIMGADYMGYVNEKEIESVYGIKDKATSIFIKLADRDAADEYRLLVMQQGIQDDVKTWKSKVSFVEDITKSLGIITSISGFVGIMTVAITIAIVIYINTSHKRRLIGVLKAIGAKDNVILTVFLMEAIFFTLFGIVAGMGMSYAITSHYRANPIPMPFGSLSPDVRPVVVFWIIAAMMVSAVFAGFYPSWKAAKQDIIKTIWG